MGRSTDLICRFRVTSLRMKVEGRWIIALAGGVTKHS